MVLARTAAPGKHGPIRQNELLRLSLSLLLTAPEGIEVNYTFVGESDSTARRLTSSMPNSAVQTISFNRQIEQSACRH